MFHVEHCRYLGVFVAFLCGEFVVGCGERVVFCGGAGGQPIA